MKKVVPVLNVIVPRTMRILLAVVIIGAEIAAGPKATAQQQSGCFIGKDYLGYPAKVYVSVEHYGDWYEIAGQIYSSGANRVYKFKADAHSGAGRLYEGHEYEAGALYISVQELTENKFVLQVESYGVFYFRRTRC